MKKVLFGQTSNAGGGEPFWQPWGFGGWIARLLGFLALLFTLLLLLSLFQKQTPYYDDDEDDDERIARLIPDFIRNPGNPIGTTPVDTTTNIRTDIDDPGRYLPPPDDNRLNPIDSTDIIDDNHRQVVRNRLNVLLDADSGDEIFNQWSEEFKTLYPSDDYKVTYYDPLTKLMQIEVPEDDRQRLIAELPQEISDISFMVFPEGMLGPLAHQPNDPAFQEPQLNWYFDPIQCYDAWDITMGSPNIIVAIVDSYFDLGHDDLNSERIVMPYSVWRRTGNVAPDESVESPCFEHGSMVASQALGTIDNERGAAGIAPLCKFMPISMGHQFTSMTMVQGVLYAIYQGAAVVNISAGTSWPDEVAEWPLEEQIEFARTQWLEEQGVWDWVTALVNQRNVTLVWAAGNENVFSAMDASKRGPASIKVSALDTDLTKASFSNFGNFPEYNVEESTVSAPGVDIIGAKPFNTYDIGPGTSFAAPIVTGVVALMKSIDPTLSTAEITQILQETGKPVPNCPTIGPMIQVRDALLRVKENFANFDDIMQDHSKIIGLWRSTTLMHRVSQGVTHPEDELRIYFDIQSESAGQFICCEVRPKDDYVAPLQINWGSDVINVNMTQTAQCEGRDRSYDQTNYRFTKDPETGQVKVLFNLSDANGGGERSFFIRKVRERNDN